MARRRDRPDNRDQMTLARTRSVVARILALAVLLFAMQPLLHAHPGGRVPPAHAAGLHAPGPDLAAAASAPACIPDPVVVADGLRDPDPAVVTDIVVRAPLGSSPERFLRLAPPGAARALAARPPPARAPPR
jgi:hypothetical protein